MQLFSNIELPADQTIGVHADAVSVWHTNEVFTIDFLAMRSAPHPGTDADGNEAVHADYVVSSRVRIPPTHVIELMKVLELQLSQWETETGQRPTIERPHPDLT